MGHTATLGAILACVALQANAAQHVETNMVTEVSFRAEKPHANPFVDVVLDVVIADPEGTERKVPAFWAGGDTWKVRYASPVVGIHRYRTECSDAEDAGLHGVEGEIDIVPYTGDNPLYRHGPIEVAADSRHFAHADGTPFFWLGDTWWKCLCKRMTWGGFQELTADRKAKGFTVVQIVCGPYPDEDAFEDQWENEGGKPYLDLPFTQANPAYFDYADRRAARLRQHAVRRRRGVEAALAASRGAIRRLPRGVDCGRRSGRRDPLRQGPLGGSCGVPATRRSLPSPFYESRGPWPRGGPGG